MCPKITEREYNVHYYEVDYKKECLITSLMNYFQDIAIFQSENSGVGIDYLRENNIAWVLHKWDIDIKRYPVYGQKIKVRTIPYSLYKFYAYRKFEVEDEYGEIIVSANTEWLLINTESKKLVKIGEAMYRAYSLDNDCSKKYEIEDINAPDKIDFEKEFEVRYSDIDTNKHVNNVKYVDWSIETVPLEIVLGYKLKKLQVIYKKETTFGEVIKSRTKLIKDEGLAVCNHSIVDNDGKELCILKTVWIKN